MSIKTGSKSIRICGKMFRIKKIYYLEEPSASIAGKDAVVFAGGVVGAYLAWDIVQDPA